MNTVKSSSCLHQFSWEEWDNQLIAVLYRFDRRFVVKRYIERVFTNSKQWQKLAHLAFSKIEPIARAYPMTENEVKLMHHLFSWHLDKTLTFPIIGGLDQLLDWEDVLNFIECAQEYVKTNQENDIQTVHSSSIVPTIPVGILNSITPTDKTSKNTLTSINNSWIQINNICVPYIIKSQQIRLLPYQVLLDCDLFDEQEKLFLSQLTVKACSNDIQTFERIISSSSSIDFQLTDDLRLIELNRLIFGMSKVVYVKLLNNQRDVNKSYKTVLAQSGGTVRIQSHTIPFIRLGKVDYIVLESFLTAVKSTVKVSLNLRRRSVPAQSHEIDYLRLIKFYQEKENQDNLILSNQQLISINDIRKYINENDLVYDMCLRQYQQMENEKLKKQFEIDESKAKRKPTKRKPNRTMKEVQSTIAEQ